MSAPPPDMLPGKPEDYYTPIPQRKGGTDDLPPWVLARNILGALLFSGLAVYFNNAGNPTAALFCLTTAGALFLHSGRRRGKGGPMDPSTAGLPISVACLAFLAFGCSGWALPTGRARVLESVVGAVQPPPLSATGRAAAPVVRGTTLWIRGVDFWLAGTVFVGGHIWQLDVQRVQRQQNRVSQSTRIRAAIRLASPKAHEQVSDCVTDVWRKCSSAFLDVVDSCHSRGVA